MSVSFGAKVEMAIEPYKDLDELLEDLENTKGGLTANQEVPVGSAIAALELLRDFLAGEVG